MRDSAALLDATNGRAPGDPSSIAPPAMSFVDALEHPLGPLRIAVSTCAPTGAPVEAECVAAVRATAALLTELGHRVEENAPAVNMEAAGRAQFVAWAAGNAWLRRHWAAQLGREPQADELEPLTVALVERGNRLTAVDLLAARGVLEVAARQVARFFVDHDVFVTPTLAGVSPPLGSFDADPDETMRRDEEFNPFCPMANISGHPAMTLPLWRSRSGLPVGVHFHGRWGDDATLLRLAAQLEEGATMAFARGSAARVTVFKTIRQRLTDCSPAERRVARMLLSGPATAGLGPAGQLATAAGVSGATVTRFVDRLGYSGYLDFQAALREEIHARLISPAALYSEHSPQDRPEGALRASHAVVQEAVASTMAQVELSDFQSAVELLSGARQVLAAGGRFSELLAMRLVGLLREVRPGARLIPLAPNDRAAIVLDAGRRDVGVFFDYRRYERSTISLARAMHQAGVPVVLFTDPWLSPIAQFASAAFSVSVESASPFESLTPGLAVVEAVAAGVIDAVGTTGRARVEKLGQLTDTLARAGEPAVANGSPP